MIALSPAREQELVDALADAFTPKDLDVKVAEPLKIPAAERSGARDVRERARALVKWATSNGVDKLVDAALNGNPTNSRLREFAASMGLLASPDELLAAVERSQNLIDPSAWTRRLAETQRQVCGIRMKAGSSGETQCTGFLVGDDIVMTARSPIVPAPQGNVLCVFEHDTVESHPEHPIVVEADHVRVLRLARPIARTLQRGSASVAVRTRGFISPRSGVRPHGDELVIVVQYTGGALRVSAGTNEPAGPDDDHLRYHTATYSGSLGAPCFDANWNFVGLHIGGESGVNYGRSADAIVRALTQQGYRWNSSTGISRAPKAAPPPSAGSSPGEHDALIRGIAASIDPDDVWSDDVDDLDLDKGACWAWVEAAAVHATFDAEKLVPFGEAGKDTRVALLLESRQVGGRWVLNDRVRRAALERLAKRGALEQARKSNPADPADRVDVALGDLIAGTQPKPDDLRDPDALRALLTAVGWLDGIVTPLPDAGSLRAALERAALLAPFHHLTKGFFAGREKELAQLTEYCDGDSTSPLFIHAPGGMGKSALLARFVLQNVERDPANPEVWRPFVYIDFDRPELDAANLASVLVAIVRQLGAQIPSIAPAAQKIVAAALHRKQTALRRRPNRKRGNIASDVATSKVADVLDDVLELLKQLPADKPIVMILDTLEEVQFSNPDALAPLVALIARLQAHAPQLRPILAGRVLAGDEVMPMALGGLRLPACVALLQNELPKELAANTPLVARLAEIVAVRDEHDKLRGNPLSLRLAAEVVRREAESADRVIEELDADLQTRVGDAIVQGRLYERIVKHLHDKRVAPLAHPGFALRVITWELIRDVLAGPCHLGDIDEGKARELFDSLAREVALVTQGDNPGQLELRPELRRIVREDLARDTRVADQRTSIHEGAIAFYEKRSQLSDRAEEIYHRLALDQDPAVVDKRWLTGVEPFLRDAVGELPPRSNAYLANRVGGVADEKQIATAAPIEWEEYARKRATDLLKFGQPQRALDLLASRADRLPASKLHYVESIARRTLPTPDLAGAEVAADAAVAAARASSNADDLRDALEELVHVRQLRKDSAGVLRGLAELANLGDALGDDLVLLEATTQGLESIAGGGEREQFTESAVRVFSRLPDELVAKAPDLSRRVAAQIGGSEPAMLQRVLRLVGTGSLDRAAASGLHDVLEEWQHSDPQVGAYIPAASKSPREIASAARYLASTREMDTLTAGRFADWLGSVVTPKTL